jgi:peroxiredoxin
MTYPETTMRSFSVLVLACSVCLGGFAVPVNAGETPTNPTKVDDFALLDHKGEFQQLSRHADAAVIVLYAFATGCPIVRQNLPEVQAMAYEYAAQGVRIAAIDASPADDRAAVVEELKTLGLNLPVLMDDTQLISESLGITRTGEALVIRTKDWTLAWRGPFDDRVGYGAQKPVATRRYLREALDAVLAGKTPPSDAPPAKGCALTFTQARADHRPDFAKDIAPIIDKNCRECHQKGGVAPWAMDSHKQVAGRGAMIREVIRTRAMPPWDADPAHGSFANSCALTIAEMRAVVHWVEQGAAGSATDPLAERKPKPIPEWPLGKPDLIVDLPPQEIPATGTIPYRNGSVSVNLPQDTWIRAVHLRPDHAVWLHHAFVFADGDEELPEDMLADPRIKRLVERFKGQELPPELKERLEKQQRQRGLTSFFATYVPGLEPAAYPEGTGRLLRKNETLPYQLHYTTNGTAGTDRPRLGLYFAKKPPERELKITSAFNLRFDIPPNTRRVPSEATRAFPETRTLYALSPHMHYRGSSMRFIAEYPDGKQEILLSVPKYDLDWQRTYVLREPKTLPGGTKIRCEGVFDNSTMNPDNPDASKRVRFGPQSWDEMFIGYLVYSQPRL